MLVYSKKRIFCRVSDYHLGVLESRQKRLGGESRASIIDKIQTSTHKFVLKISQDSNGSQAQIKLTYFNFIVDVH
jgi:hypothetical protein